MMRPISVLVSLALAAASAASAGDLSAQEFKAAKKLHVTKCAKCHQLYEPGAYSQADWTEWMQKMARKSRLSPAQFTLLSSYLETLRTPGKKTP